MAASQRRARVFRWAMRSIAVLVIVGVLGALQYRSAMQARVADEQARLATQEAQAARALANARTIERELEQGRAALLHGEPEALPHLARAYRGEPSPTTAFMLARAMEPRLAERARFASTFGRMWWAAFSPDGRQIVTTDDRAAQIWDAQTHALLFTLPHGCEVYQALYRADSKRLVTIGETMVRIWDTSNGALIRDLKEKPGQATDYFQGAISLDGTLVAVIDAAGATVHVWDVEGGALVAELHLHGSGFPSLAFDASGWLGAAGGDELRVYDRRTWTPVVTIPGQIYSLAFDDHGRLATGAANGDVTLWAVPSGVRLHDLRQLADSVDAIAFSPNRELVAAGSRDGTMQMWQVKSGGRWSQLNPRHSKILGIEFDAASKLLLAASADGTAIVADVAQGLPVAVLEGPQSAVRAARFGPNQQIVGASWDGVARVWDAASPLRRFSSEPAGRECGSLMGTIPEGRFVAIGCGTRPTVVWDTAHDQRLAELPAVTPIVTGAYTSASPAVSTDGERAAIARGNTVELYEVPGGRLLRRIDHNATVSAVAFTSGGHDVVSGAIDGSTIVTREDSLKQVFQARGGIDAVELLPDGRVVVSDAARRLRVYASSGAILADLETPARIRLLRRKGNRIVALSSYNGPAAPPFLIDLEHYRIGALLDGHIGRVFSARWASDQRIITAGADGTARLWDGETGHPLQTYTGGPRFLADAMLTPDGLVIGGDADGLVRFWDGATGVKLWILQAHRSPVIGVHLAGDGSSDIVTLGFTGEISRWQFRRPEQVIDLCVHDPHCAILPR
jgi:WD40 repeat protein